MLARAPPRFFLGSSMDSIRDTELQTIAADLRRAMLRARAHLERIERALWLRALRKLARAGNCLQTELEKPGSGIHPHATRERAESAFLQCAPRNEADPRDGTRAARDARAHGQ